MLPTRTPESHKGSYGKVLAVCGSSPYRGAAVLSVMGALRTGAGLVTLAAPECVVSAAAARVPEAIFLPDAAQERILEEVSRSEVCLLGCGLSADADTAQLAKKALDASMGVVVLDAGALCSLADDISAITAFAQSQPLIVTPHPGEMARLCRCSVEDIEKERTSCALDFALSTGAITVLKGHETLIACPDGTLYENLTGNAGLARGGSGDILAGMIAGLAAQGMSAEHAAAAGVFLHGLSADRCAARLSMQGMLPSDILTDLCNIFLEKEQKT
ncbi:MAG TPA: NAD(P)H-hydrate dehydratase [Candidatus Ruthenibacterium merdavium]|uniref:ADP-dependent (S)-NAD(P)H-hydrate dehydratase n=1 Tax=Candidatus Ruthenibacterium merdavium TaxID=2838752 RepID=A0A9D2TJY2_9FIRM|nr:NAD(P)H-hydrate dehydratase [Candidatus Ruthenibacterium merdavium]